MVEQGAHNATGGGSIPPLATKMPERNLAVISNGGSKAVKWWYIC